MNALPKRATKRREPVYLMLRDVVIPETGETRRGFVAADPREAQVLRGRKYKLGDVLRADIFKPRNPKHHRLVMATLQALVDAVDSIDTIDQALMLCKVGMGYADPVIDGTTGRTLYVVRSISFDAMSQDAFEKFHTDLCRFIARRYMPGMSAADVANMAELMAGSDT